MILWLGALMVKLRGPPKERPRCAHQMCRQASDNVHASRAALIRALHWGGRCATLSFDYRSFTRLPRRNVGPLKVKIAFHLLLNAQ